MRANARGRKEGSTQPPVIVFDKNIIAVVGRGEFTRSIARPARPMMRIAIYSQT